jgi:hypothetical protein
MLVAVEREFRAVGHDGVEDALDELARPLFGLERAPLDERVIGLGRAAWAALPEEGEAPADWLLGSALERGRAAGAVRAVLAVELAGRAGMGAHPARLRGCWAVHLRADAGHAAADVGACSGLEPCPRATGCLCAHQLAFVVLTSLMAAWRSAADPERTRQAGVLRLVLERGGASCAAGCGPAAQSGRSPGVSRARYSSSSIGTLRVRSATASRSAIDASSSTCSSRNHWMNCSLW